MRFQCPYCRGIVAVDNSDLGIDVQCGHCREIVTVPCSRVATGAVIADFIILQELGRGGMGIVYLAHQISLDRPAALKILSEHYANNAEFVVGFIKEARAAAKLNHPHIVQAYAVGEDEGIFYFAMENVDGETMKSVLKREKVIPIEQALSIIQQVAEALDYAWKEQRLIHRDIKPDNIMLTSNGRAKLADLGLARVAGEIDDSEDDEVMGTPQYISPEHLTGAPMDIRSDIYSLGATFFHFVTGKFPFEGRTATEIARKHLEEKLRSPKEFNSAVPEEVCLIIGKMMAKNQKDRYQDAEQLVDDLRQVRRGKRPNISSSGSTSTEGMSRSPTGSVKKTVLVTTKHKTGVFKATESGIPTATGPLTGIIGTTSTTGLHSKTSIHNLKKLHEEQAKRKLIAILAVCVAAVLLSIGVIIWALASKGKPAKQPAQQAGSTAPAQQRPAPEREPKGTAYTIKASEILAYAKGNPSEDDQIIRMCEDFFINFPEPKYNIETEKLQDMLAVYVPLDEKRLAAPRKEARRKFESALAEHKLREEQERDEERKKLQAEKERKRFEEERAKQDKLRKEKEEREFKEYCESLDSAKDAARVKAVDLFLKKDFKGAEDLFGQIAKETERAKGKQAKHLEAAKDYAAWGKRMADGFAAAQKVDEMLTNSGSELAGTQIEIKSGSLGKITEIKNGEVTVVTFTNKTMSSPLDQIPVKQLVNLAKKAAVKAGNDDAPFYYFLATGDFSSAKELAADEDLKSEASNAAVAYVKAKLKGASEADKAEIQRKYGSLEEYKSACPEEPAPK